MLASLTIERFRGFQRLHVAGLRRVNLIIGKNDCGKTAFMEAAEVLDSVKNAMPILHDQQRRRAAEDYEPSALDFDRFWLPLFWAHGARVGFELAAEPFRRWIATTSASSGSTATPTSFSKRRLGM